MKKSTFIMLVCLLGGNLLSQVSFYVQPNFSMKYASQSVFLNKLGNNFVPPNKHFHPHYPLMFFQSTQLYLGIGFGINYKKKHFFNFNINQDSSPFLQRKHAQYYFFNSETPNEIVSTNAFGSYSIGGQDEVRFSLMYENYFYSTKKGGTQIRYITGLGIMFNPLVKPKSGIYQEYETPLIFTIGSNLTDGGIHIDGTLTQRKYRRRGFALQMGLGFDFNTKKKVYLFSLDVFYKQGLVLWGYGDFNDTVFEPQSNLTYYYKQELITRGSGLYFQLSRKINVYPWRPNKKPKE